MRILGGTIFVAVGLAFGAAARPVPRPAMAERLADGPEVIGIVHWGLNTYTDREWGYGDEDPAMLNPAKFDADQIVGACKAGGIGGLVVVAKHHDGFCLWPTKTTEHNITKTPFWRGTGNGERGTGRDYVKEMEQACRRAGVKFGVYCSPWDRNSAHYATDKYVEIYHAQIKELLGGAYGEVFEMWFDGANGGDGYYGGAREKRRIGAGYYRFDEIFTFVRALQPRVTIFSGEESGDLRWPGNEQGMLDPDSRATVDPCGGIVDGKYGNPNYKNIINTGLPDGSVFKVCEADFPLRKGWFYHESERGTTRSAAYLTKLYLSSVGNGGVMNIGIAPNKDGLLDADDVEALAGFKTLKDALFAHEAKQGEPFNVVVMREDISKGEQVDEWEFVADGKAILCGKSIGLKRIRVLETPCAAKSCEVKVLKDGGALQGVSFKLYRADPELVRLVLSAATESGETDTAKWMTAGSVRPLAEYPGEVGEKTDWKCVGSEEGKVVYIPFEGYYESKGGRIESPRFKLDGEIGKNRFYRLTFSAKCPVDGYWWVDFFDAEGNHLPDVNSRLYASEDWMPYDVMVPARPDAAFAQIAFVTKKGAQAKDVSIRQATVAEAAKWCSDLAVRLPKLDAPETKGAWDGLPKTREKILSGKRVNIVFLGDSIMNDTWCGNAVALIQDALPKSDLRCYLSVRGSTGCWYYHEKDHFAEYVGKYKPDLVVIGGISNYGGPEKQTLLEAEDSMAETISRCHAIGAEVVICTPPPSYEFRKDAAAKPFDRSLVLEDGGFLHLQQKYERRAAKRTGVQVWDLTTAPCEAIARSGKPLDWFKRDAAHNDDRGKQLIAQTLAAYFRTL